MIRTNKLSLLKLTSKMVYLLTQGDIAALTAFYDNGYWLQKSEDDYENISQDQAEAIEYEDVTCYLKYTICF